MQYSRVMVVAQDAELMEMLCSSIALDPAMWMAGCCRSAGEAVRLAFEIKPDVIALDMNVADKESKLLLGQLHNACGAAVVAISTVTGNAIQTLENGAADFIHMPVEGSDSDHSQFIEDTIERLKIALFSKKVYQQTEPDAAKLVNLLVISAAAGGPVQLACLLHGLPGTGCPPVLVLQQKPEAFGSSYTALLAGITGRAVLPAADGMEIQPGSVIIADADKQAAITENGGKLMLELYEKGVGAGCEDTADELFRSAAQALGESATGISFSGNGQNGLKYLARRGALAILHNKNALLRYVGYKPAGGLMEMPLEDMAGEIQKRMNLETIGL